MTVCRAIETAIASILRHRAELGADVVLRPFRALPHDGSWDDEKDRSFPMVDIRCTPPRTDADERTFYSDCVVTYATKADDDKDHAQFDALEEAIQTALENVYDGHWKASTDEYGDFIADFAANAPAVHFGGVAFPDSIAPGDNAGANMASITLRIHFSR